LGVLQYTMTLLAHTATHHTAVCTATLCTTLQHTITAPGCKETTHYNALQHTISVSKRNEPAHFNTLPHTATHNQGA